MRIKHPFLDVIALSALIAALQIGSNHAAAQATTFKATDTQALKAQVGKQVTVTGKVIDVVQTNDGQYTILQFSKAPGAFFAGVIKKNYDAVFKPIGDPKSLLNKEVQVKGIVARNQPTGEPMIMLDKATDLAVAGAAPPPGPPAAPVNKPLDATQTAEVKKSIGKTATVKGTVKRVADTSDRQAKMILFSKDDQFGFAAVVYKQNYATVFKAFGGNDQGRRDKTVELTGRGLLNTASDAPMMVSNKPDQIKLVESLAPGPGAPGAPPAGNMPKIKTGLFRHYFKKNVKHQPVSKVSRLLQKQPERSNEYDVTKESFVVYVPKTYRPGMPHALMVWLGNPEPSASWATIFEKHHIIWIAPSKAGVGVTLDRRISLAIDAAVNIGDYYSIDRERVYIGGGGSGGIAATATALTFPDIFVGGTFMLGIGYYRELRVPGERNTVWRPDFAFPPSASWSRAKSRSRLVVVSGALSTNHDRVKTVYTRGFQPERFRYMSYIEVPDLSNTLPDRKVFEQVVRVLDAPIGRTAMALYRKGQTTERAKRYAMAYDNYAMAAMRSGGNDKLASDAMQKAKDLYEKLHQVLAEREQSIVAMIDEQRYPQATLAIKRMEKEFGVHAKAVSKTLTEKMEEARDPKRTAAARPVKPKTPGRTSTPANPNQDREQFAARREESAKEALAEAREQLGNDLVTGYIALTALSKKYKGTKAADEARTQAQDIYLKPENRRILKPVIDEAEAEKQMNLIETYIKLKKFEDAKEELRELIKEYPRTKTAVKARKLLEEVRVILIEQAKKNAER